ncbi:MAG: glycosyltransferase family 2 protein, partial [Desertimonas sp.]
TLDDDDPPQTPEMIAEIEALAEGLVADGSPVGGVGLCGGRFDLARGRLVTVPDAELVGAVASSWLGGNQLPCYRIGAVRRVGVFDPRYFINFEELDYGLRMLDHGLVLYAHGPLWRRERTRLGRPAELAAGRRLGEPHWRRYYSVRNLVFLLRARHRWRAAIAVTLVNLAKPLANAPRTPGLAIAHLRLNTRALADGWLGRMGRTVPPAPKTDRRRP